MWECCLFKGNRFHVTAGPAPIRIRTFGHVFKELPLWLDTTGQDMRELWEAGIRGQEQWRQDLNDYL
jgi:hypothetical protein